MSGDHDLGYKQLFAHPVMVRDLLAGFTPLACFRGLEPGAFERVNASFVSELHSERHGDMVWRVRIADHVVYVYLLLEFQSQTERWMALRMQVYVGLLYQDLVKRRELAPEATLPPVLPVVFYNGSRPWNASHELRTLVAAAPDELHAYQASQRYLLIDQRSIDFDRLENSRNLVAELFRLELSDSASVLIDVVATLATWLAGDDQASLRNSIAQWINYLQKRELRGELLWEAAGILSGSEEDMGERLERKYATWFDAARAGALEEGRGEGLARGREEKLLALRSVLKGLLYKRFGDIPNAALARIERADEGQLTLWIPRVVDAQSIDQVFQAES